MHMKTEIGTGYAKRWFTHMVDSALPYSLPKMLIKSHRSSKEDVFASAVPSEETL